MIQIRSGHEDTNPLESLCGLMLIVSNNKVGSAHPSDMLTGAIYGVGVCIGSMSYFGVIESH